MLIVLDQFEQWLHAKRDEQDTELVQALRQCDGQRVQCLVMVRDDFWMAATRFMRELEIRLVEDQNFAAVDLFDIAPRQEIAGRVRPRLRPASRARWRDRQVAKEFLNRAVAGLAEDGKVICVRLALFADMMKGKPWTSATLKEVGGTEGVGVTFLEETFTRLDRPARIALSPESRPSELKALLPESGTDIKGHMQSHAELLAASGYAGRPQEFADLIRILDSELRLVTPTDPEGVASEEEVGGRGQGPGGKEVTSPATPSPAPSPSPLAPHFYQLTHDYLVPALRDWLTRKQRETRRGRAELRLAERSTMWNAKPENRHLPSLAEYLRIRWLTKGATWTAPQRRMMRRAGRLHALRSVVAAALVLALFVGGREIFGRIEARALVEQLNAADIAEVPRIVDKLAAYRRWADPMLTEDDRDAEAGSKPRLHTALALLPVDENRVQYLGDQLQVVTPAQFPVVRDALLSHRNAIVEPLWTVALDSQRATQPRFQAACALATYAPDDLRWSRINALVADRLVALQASELVAWRKALRPAQAHLVAPLATIYRNPAGDRQQRAFATETLADYAAENPATLVDLVADAEPFQFPVIFAKLTTVRTAAVPLAETEVARPADEKASEIEKERLAKRQANLAVALLRMGKADGVWPVLKFSPDPRARSYLIHWISPLGGDPQTIIKRLDAESDVTIRRALVLTLGEFNDTQLPVAERKPLIEKLLVIYENEPDAGLHGAAEWLLRKWGHGERLQGVVNKLRGNEVKLQARKASDKRGWYVNTQGQTFAMLDAGEFLMGSPESEPGHRHDEILHRCRIGRRFAISATHITKAQYRTFQQAVKGFDLAGDPQLADIVPSTDDSPQTGMTWYEAAEYCNWLSEKERIEEKQWCYEPKEKGSFGPGMKAKEKYLELSGYRLPTEAEWEFACRAHTVTSRYYGLSDTLLAQCAWYQANGKERTWPVGSLKPNDFGLFDIQGNCWDWCDDRYQDYPDAVGALSMDLGSTKPVDGTESRVLRGGAFDDLASFVRSANRNNDRPANRDSNGGFRPARTLPLDFLYPFTETSPR